MTLNVAEIAARVKALTPAERTCIDLLQRAANNNAAHKLSPRLFDLGYVERDDDGTPFLTYLGTQIGIGLQENDDHGGMSA